MDQATKWLDLSGKVVIVTGGSMGLGEKMVENLHANGATVVYADLSPNQTFSQCDDITFIKCDVTDKKEIENLTQSVVAKFGHIDGLVNNAGVSRPRLLVDVFKEKPEYELSEDDFDFMVNVNQKAVFLMSQSVARQMVEQQSGVIINMTSEAGVQGSRGQSCYSATKAAVNAFTFSWSKELGPYNVRVVSVEPAINVPTPMNSEANFRALAYTNHVHKDYKGIIPLGRPGKLEEIADLISFLVSEHSSYITGSVINITGGKSHH
ncbi:SDR family NAD(P)-dependent oxidoreductase [Salmonella enterica]|nr:SDR family NAD(P)-dependent oxidoreductase [Salmonella enterica]EBU2793330.1 SDR family NAD(P)-dependent oxidoreductase [Salmonella enterica]EDO3719596.1 SDR family NAD(P)-dependent oxidoreductase [Salmonella enterica]EDQ1302822.1 SDR family NAD(P)-dependent oxidoreductase [Salmonella enterica]EEA1746547.1 SDR family NAD(P)-dependent oxidoreductase [Salmonella enterica]